LLVTGLAAPFAASAATSAAQPQGTEQPRINWQQARQLGLDRVPEGTVKTQRLQHDNGKLVWFIDINGYNSRSREEILVDADTGHVISSHARPLTGPSTPRPSSDTMAG
jgi:uncharacterized membrane protein YkoI